MLAPLVEAGPRAQVLAESVEPLLDLRPDGPVTVTAVALIVDGGCLVAADAFLPHGLETAATSVRLRRAILAVARREERLGPVGDGGVRRRVGGGQGGKDRFAFVLAGLRRDVDMLHHPEEGNALAQPGR